jgi:hypothetical protein
VQPEGRMKVSSRTILLVIVVVAVFLVAGISMRGQGGGFLHRLGATIHGHR